MFLIFVFLLAALLYSVAERHTRGFSAKRIGGLTFVRAGRLSLSYSVRRG